MDFGLGLILSFTDNATAGINGAVNSLNQLTNTAQGASDKLSSIASLSAFSSIATSIGNSMTSAGNAILSTFGQVISKVNETGTTLMYAENQLDKLYADSGRTGKQVLADISDYAKKSIFEYENLISVVTMLKANGIEAFETITSSSGKSAQTLMDYAADLAAFNPAMRNAYGTGINAAMGALNEYIAEGNARSLKSGASLDITGLLGEEKGKTVEERARQVADLLEQLGMVGMTAQLANTPMTKLSNMADTLFQFLGMISNSGVYDAYNDIIDVISGFVNSIPEERLQNIASIVGSALTTLLQPVKALAEWLVKLADGFLKLVESNPGLAKFATIAVAIGGALLVVGGIAMKLLGSLGYLTLMISQLGTSFGAIGGIMKAGAVKILGALIPLTLAIGGLYFAWKHDLFNLRTNVTNIFNGIVNSFQTAKSAVSGSLEDMKAVLATLDPENSFFDGLTLGIMRVMVLMDALKEGWNNFTLSEDTFQKAKELGILPLIESLFDLKYRFDNFKQGFIEGWKEISNWVTNFFSGLKDAFKGTIFDTILDKITGFFQKLTDNDAGAWKNAGNIFAKITAGLIGLWAAVKLFKGVGSIFGLGKKGGGISGLIRNILGGKGGDSSSTGGSDSIFVHPLRMLKTMASLGIMLGGAMALVAAIGKLYNMPGFDEAMNQGIAGISKLFSNLVPVLATTGSLALFMKALDLLKINPGTVLLGIADIALILAGMTAVLAAFGALHSIQGFDDFIAGGGETLSNMFSQLGKIIGSAISGFGEGISSGLPAIGQNIADFATNIKPFFDTVGSVDLTNMGSFLTSLNRMFLIMTGEKIADWITGGLDFAGVGKQLADFATNSAPFFTSVEGISDSAFENAGKMFESLNSLNKYEFKSGGLAQMITGEVALDKVGEQLGSFATSATPFFSAVEGISETSFTNAGKMFESLNGLNNYSFKEGGLLQKLTGEVAFDKIGEQLSKFTTNGADFFSAVQDIPDKAFTNVTSLFTSLEGIDNFAFKEGGLLQKLTGELSFDKVGEQLSSFTSKGANFFTSVADMDDSGFDKATKLFSALDGLNNLSFKEGGLLQKLTGELAFDKVGQQLNSFVTDGAGFFTSVASMPEDGFTKASQLFESLSGLSMYEFKSGGLLQQLTGEVNIGQLGSQLANFATGATPFFNSVESMTDDQFTNAGKMFESLSGLSMYEFKSGGLLQKLTGEVNIGSLGEQLATFATGAQPFFSAMGNMTEDQFTNAGKMFESLSGLSMYEFKEGGFLQAITGTVNLGSLGTQLNEFSKNAPDFFSAMGNLNDTQLENAGKMFESLSGLGAYEFKEGGLAQFITGSTNFGKIGTQLSDFAKNSGDFFSTVEGISEGSFTNMGKLFEAFNSLGQYDFKTGGVAQFFTGETDFGAVGTQLGEFGKNSVDFFSNIGNVSEDQFNNVNRVFDMFGKLTEHEGIISTLSNQMSGFGSGVEAASNSALAHLGQNLTEFANSAGTFFDAIKNMGSGGVEDMNNMISGISSAMSTMSSLESFDPGTMLQGFSTAMSEFINSFSGGAVDTSALDTVMASITSIGTTMTNSASAFSGGAEVINTSMTTMNTNVTTGMNTINSSIVTSMATIVSNLRSSWSIANSVVSSATSTMQSNVSSKFSSMRSTVSSMMSSAVSSVTSSIKKMESAFANAKFVIKQSHIKLPHFSVSGSFSVNPPSVPKFSVSWYEQGGIFNKPSLIGVGENGTEAVMPLEKNTEWIGVLANMLNQKMSAAAQSSQFTPVNSPTPNNDDSGDNNSYMSTTNNKGGDNYDVQNDNSVVFSAGSIVINCKDASEAEAKKFAEKIMVYIKRQKELDDMKNYRQ